MMLVSCAERSSAYKARQTLIQEHQIAVVGNPMDIVINSNYAYIAQDQGGFSILDLLSYQLRWFTSVSAFDGSTVNLFRIRNLAVVDEQKKLFVNETEGTDLIFIFDYTDPDTLRVLPSITGGTSDIRNMQFTAIPNPSDQYTIEGFFSSGRLIKYGKFDDVNKMWIGFPPDIDAPAIASGIQYTDNHIFVAAEQRGLLIYDRSNFSLLSTTVVPGEAQRVMVAGNYAYLACRQEGLVIVDISNPSAPVIKGSFDTSGYASSIDVKDDMAVVSSGGGGIYLFDISSPSRPVLIENLRSCGYTNNARFYGNKIVVAARDQGVLIYRIDR